MLQWTLKKIVGSRNQRIIKKMQPLVAEINRHEQELQRERDGDFARKKTKFWRAELQKIKDEMLRDAHADRDAQMEKLLADKNLSKSQKDSQQLVLEEEFRSTCADSEEKILDAQGEYLEEILPEAFALVKNVARRLCGKSFMVSDRELAWEMVHFDVQLIGGIALHRGMIAEMATGEGKTLVATLPVYLNALTGRGVHVITVNDYLAKRDMEWMSPVYDMLGVSYGCIQNSTPPDLRREQYLKDITFGTNSEFGFDYLRDNGMASSAEYQVQREHYFAIIDEVDSVLIDEARTPLIISGEAATNSHQYDRFKHIVERLQKKQNLLCNAEIQQAKKLIDEGASPDEFGIMLFKVKLGHPKNRGLLRLLENPTNRRAMEKAELALYKDSQKRELFELKEELYFVIDEKSNDADLSEKGRKFLDPKNPEGFVMPDLATEFSAIDGDESLGDKEKIIKKNEAQRRLDAQGERIHNVSQLLKAYCLYERDVEYVVKDGRVIIVDEHTGREMPGRRWSDGLHQAIEAKEGVKIDKETQTLATITIQNYFRLYEKLAGMTGTAETEAAEFQDIYKMETIVIPTNRPVQRNDHNDKVYKSRREKYKAVIEQIKLAHEAGQPLLIGTASVDSSETLSRMLKREKIPHNVLNAKYHRQEAEIVANAGQKKAVTVATNMAGRGTDIKLGKGIADIGGLAVIGTERHESRRIDRQLRGRCARQGDPGETIFYISFEDDLMRNFGGSERMTRMLERIGLKDDEEISHPLLNKSIEGAQKRVEQFHYRSRKYVLDFDDVMNQQRTVVYGLRNDVIKSVNPRSILYEILEEALPEKLAEFLDVPPDTPPAYDECLQWLNATFPLLLEKEQISLEGKTIDNVADKIISEVKSTYEHKIEIESKFSDGDEEEDGLIHVINLERYVILTAIDRLWKEHLYAMDALRDGVNLRVHGQKDPLVEYKREAFKLFEDLMASIRVETLQNMFRSTTNLQKLEHFLASLPVKLGRQMSGMPKLEATPQSQDNSPSGEVQSNAPDEEVKVRMPIRREEPKVGRNDPCPCGSGKKYKRCHGRS